MSKSVPQRKDNPESIPAVPPAPMDAAFFARLRTIDEKMFLRSAVGSAMRGQLTEVSAALSTLRGDLYEPLLWEKDSSSSLSLKLPRHPMGDFLDKSFLNTYFSVQDLWGVVGLALVSSESPWSIATSEAFVSRPDFGYKCEFDAQRLARNQVLLGQVIDLCRVQTERVMDSGKAREYEWCVTTGEDGLTSVYGSKPWSLLLEALSGAGCLWSDLEVVVDAIPQAVIERNTSVYLQVIKTLIKNGDVPTALHLVKKAPSLVKEMVMFDGLTPFLTDRQDNSTSILYDMPSFLNQQNDVHTQDICADASLEIMDLVFKESSHPAEMYMRALALLLPSVSCCRIDPSDPNERASVSARKKLINGLVDRIDAEMRCAPVDAWPSNVKDASMKAYDFRHSNVMTRLLDAALELREFAIVSKLRLHWARDPEQVNLSKVTGWAAGLSELSDEFQRSVLSILKTAREVGIDLNEPITGRNPSSQWEREKDKSALIMHTVANATKGKVGQLELMQAMAGSGIDPTLTDKRGWKARVFLEGDDRPDWDKTVHQWATRQRAADAIQEVMTGIAAPKRGRVKAPV